MAEAFTLESAAKPGPGNYVRMRSTQLNARAVGRVFNFFPESVFLVAGDGSVELPDEDGRFQVDAMDASLVWTCEGDSCKPSRPIDVSLQPGASGYHYAYQPSDELREREKLDQQERSTKSVPSGKWKPKFKTSTLRGNRESSGKPQLTSTNAASAAWTKTIEICTFEGTQLKKSFNLPISLTEKSATVVCVTDFVSDEAFEGAAVVLLDSENLHIPDSVETRGIHRLHVDICHIALVSECMCGLK